jgi:hypothetical protein
LSTEELLPPEAALMESMRSIGYSLETALADILDNSIAAKAKSIRILYDTGDSEYIAILDDGIGMDQSELRTAMKFAGKPPSVVRDKRDLGRFGLGLKTASLSQAKRMTVASRKRGGELVAAVWDIDAVEESQAWILNWLSPSEISTLPEIGELQKIKESGTLVIWEKLDVILRDQTDEVKALTQALARAAEHISLVFHLYLDGIPADKIFISLNDRPLKAIDPFFTKNPGTQKKPLTQVEVDGNQVLITPYILPHLSQLTREERKESDFLKARFRDTQGFYIYREKRLISYGSWFRIVGKSELAKLARVKVETGNALDKAWKLGVTKSKIEPPLELRRALEHLVPNIIGDSRKVIQRTGTLMPESHALKIWRFRELGKFEFKVECDLQHPLVTALDETLSDSQRRIFSKLIDQIEQGLPVTELSARLLGDESNVATSASLEENQDAAVQLLSVLLGALGNNDDAFQALLRLEPYASQAILREHLNNGREKLLVAATEANSNSD